VLGLEAILENQVRLSQHADAPIEDQSLCSAGRFRRRGLLEPHLLSKDLVRDVDRRLARRFMSCSSSPRSTRVPLFTRRGFFSNACEVRNRAQSNPGTVLEILEDAFQRSESSHKISKVIGFGSGGLPDQRFLNFSNLLGLSLVEEDSCRGRAGNVVWQGSPALAE
jgi:hypothetical protein